MLIFVNIEKQLKEIFIIFVNLCKYHRQTDRQTHQKYSSESQNSLIKLV
jgi:hypothetical protein